MKGYKHNLMNAFNKEKEENTSLKSKVIKSTISIAWFILSVVIVVWLLQLLKDTQKQEFFKEPESPASHLEQPMSKPRENNEKPTISSFLFQKIDGGGIRCIGVAADDVNVRKVIVNNKVATLQKRGGIWNFEMTFQEPQEKYVVVVTDDEGEVTQEIFEN